MSALDILFNEMWEIPGDTRIKDARAELAALRDSLGAWATLWLHICQRLDADAGTLPNESNFDAMITALYATVAEQARRLDEARLVIDYDGTGGNPDCGCPSCRWLAANAPAPQAEQTK